MLRRVLITGASGFLGRHIAKIWQDEGAEITSLGRSQANNIVCDLRAESPDLESRVFDTVIHCAGKADSIPKNNREVNDFFRGNVEGTANLLKSLTSLEQKPERVVFISSVSVYGKDEGLGIDESAPLAGKTPYSQSKIEAEHLVRDWSIENDVAYFNLRLPLVVGTDPPGNLLAMARNIKRGTYIQIRNNRAQKSMVRAGDVAKLTLRLGNESGNYNLTDRVDTEFCEIESALADSYGKQIRWQIPEPFLNTICEIGGLFFLPINRDLHRKLTSSLTFSSDLAAEKLGWEPRSCLDFIRDGGLRTEMRRPETTEDLGD